jgi:hypothetical protein
MSAGVAWPLSGGEWPGWGVASRAPKPACTRALMRSHKTMLIRKSVVARAVLSVRSMHPADGECPVFTLRRGGLTIVQKAPGHTTGRKRA